MDKQELQSYIGKYRRLLVKSVEWWQKQAPDAQHGGFLFACEREGRRCFF